MRQETVEATLRWLPVSYTLVLVISDYLDPFANRGADQGTLQWLLVIDGRSCDRSDDRSTCLAIVVSMMSGSGEGTSGRHQQRQAENRCLNFCRSFGGHSWTS